VSISESRRSHKSFADLLADVDDATLARILAVSLAALAELDSHWTHA